MLLHPSRLQQGCNKLLLLTRVVPQLCHKADNLTTVRLLLLVPLLGRCATRAAPFAGRCLRWLWLSDDVVHLQAVQRSNLIITSTALWLQRGSVQPHSDPAAAYTKHYVSCM